MSPITTMTRITSDACDRSNGRDVHGRDGGGGPRDGDGRSGGGDSAGSFDLAPQVSSVLLREVIDQHRELDLKTLRYHLDQADATARAGCWHAAVNEARSFVEGLIVGIAEFESARRQDLLSGLSPSPESRSGYQECRKYLVTVGFADVDEMDLFKQVYSVASRKGSHPGVTDEAWGRLVCHLAWMAGYFLLNRYAAWKSHRRRWPTDRSSTSERRWNPLNSCRHWLGGVARRVLNGRQLAAQRIHGRTDAGLASSSIETAD